MNSAAEMACTARFGAWEQWNGGLSWVNGLMDKLVADLHPSRPIGEGGNVRYPSQRILARRRESLEKGVSVDLEIWEQMLSGM